MAGLISTGIWGFICSCLPTGKRDENGKPIYAEHFLSGFAGWGWKIWKTVAGFFRLEIDELVVRRTMTVFELMIHKIRAIIGAYAITQGNGKIKSVVLSTDGTEYLIALEDKYMSLVEYDFIRCQEFDGGQKLYHVEIASILEGVIHVPVSEFEGSSVPEPGDEIIQFGNSSHDAKYAGRHSAIYIHADESGQPAIDVMFDIYEKDWTNCVKVRVGGDIPGSGGLKGFYCENGMIKCVDKNKHTTYCLHPDGTAELGDGAAIFRPDKSGHIAGGAIKWEWNEDKKKYVCTMGDVLLTWDNLSDETKENLKGEPGKDGNPGHDGVDGSDGVNGGDGTSLIYKGEFLSHPADPQNGWYYRNTTDKKSYVYHGAWYVMTIDGSDGTDGKNGLDGINGKDGNDGLSVIWKGDSVTPPADPQKNWAYRDTDNGRVYIYNGTAWALMVADGSNGTDGTNGTDGSNGMSIFVTYHDSETEPTTPTGDGTSDGWHTDGTSTVVWMSQKVTTDAATGEWGAPIRIKGKDGADSGVPDWLQEWFTNGTQIGDDFVVSPKFFSGTKNADGKLTGIAQGKDCITIVGVKRTGIFALVDNEVVFELDPINKKYKFTGEIETSKDGKRIVISPENKDIRVFDDLNKNVLTIEGINRTSINGLFANVIPTITIKNLPLYLSSKKITQDISDPFYTNGLISFRCGISGTCINDDPRDINILLSVYNYNDSGLTDLKNTIVVFNYIGKLNWYEDFHFEDIIFNLGEGYHVIKATLSSDIATYDLSLKTFSCIPSMDNYMSTYFANGLALGTSNINMFAFLNKKTSLGTNAMIGIITNGKEGIELSQDDILVQRKGHWGMMPSIVACGEIRCQGSAVTFLKISSFDKKAPILSKNAVGDIIMTMPQTWKNAGVNRDSCYILITETIPDLKVHVITFDGGSIYLGLESDKSILNASFYFEIKLY